ncbi:MAG: DUF4870 domain-containing protein [Planctomycetaceae bacterium]
MVQCQLRVIEAAMVVTREEKIWAMLCHALALLRIRPVIWTILIPLAIWLGKRDSSAFVDRHGRESLNFQISIVLYHLVLGTLLWLVGLSWFANYVLESIVIVCVIIAAIRASEGRLFRYPFTIRFLR